MFLKDRLHQTPGSPLKHCLYTVAVYQPCGLLLCSVIPPEAQRGGLAVPFSS